MIQRIVHRKKDENGGNNFFITWTTHAGGGKSLFYGHCGPIDEQAMAN